MEDAKRFLRYVLPGLAFVIYTVSYLFLSYPRLVISKFESYIINSQSSIGVLLTVFLLSGGIGYVLSIIYHFLYGIDWLANLLGLANHRQMIISAGRLNYLEFREEDNFDFLAINEIDRRITRSGAWRILNALWHERAESSPEIRGANPRIDSLSDLTHGSGTTLVGAVMASLLYLLVSLFAIDKSIWQPIVDYWLWTFLLFLILIFLHFGSYRQILQNGQGVVEKILLGVLREESGFRRETGRGRWPAIALVNQRDLMPP